ncbi:MAG: argininosuccinate lyase, partial [Longimicrobiales bacterium]|nr:argininosuccinate lyase [Longimicrobiales bacterium]
DFADFPDEDVHSLVERLLFEEVGEVAGKLHTARSRNDQVATDMRLWGMEAADVVADDLRDLCRALIGLAEESLDVILPGYTHLQQAQPVRGSHWALSHFWAFLSDVERVERAGEAAAILPLGSGALAGCPFPVNREVLREELGFRSVSPNSLHAVSDRDWMLDFLHAGAVVGVHLSRLAEDLVVYTSKEFGVFRLADGYSTGSSLMPQKRNPDVAELARGKSGRLAGNLVALLTLLKGLPSSYNRDLQEEKPPLFDTVDTLGVVLPAVTGAVETGRFVPEAASRLLDVQLLATDLADYLVRKGVPFRESHEVVGRLVRKAEDEGVGLDELSESDFQDVHSAFEADVFDVFSWEASVDARNAAGGTGRAAVEEQLVRARRALGS